MAPAAIETGAQAQQSPLFHDHGVRHVVHNRGRLQPQYRHGPVELRRAAGLSRPRGRLHGVDRHLPRPACDRLGGQLAAPCETRQTRPSLGAADGGVRDYGHGGRRTADRWAVLLPCQRVPVGQHHDAVVFRRPRVVGADAAALYRLASPPDAVRHGDPHRAGPGPPAPAAADDPPMPGRLPSW